MTICSSQRSRSVEEGTQHPGSRPGASQKVNPGTCHKTATVSPSVGHGEPAAASVGCLHAWAPAGIARTQPLTGLTRPLMENEDMVRRQAARKPERDHLDGTARHWMPLHAMPHGDTAPPGGNPLEPRNRIPIKLSHGCLLASPGEI